MRRTALVATSIVLLAGCATDSATTTTTSPEADTTVSQTPTTEVTETTGAPPTTVAETTTTTTSVVEATTTTEPGPLQLEIAYENGQVVGGGRIEVPLGEPVRLTIVSDVIDDGHLHGYDIFVDLQPGISGTIEFTADIPGIFELELESSRVLLADIEVSP